MMHRMFNCTNRTFVHLRSFDQAAKTLWFSPYRQDLFTSRSPFSLICCHSDYCTYVNIKEKQKLLVSVNSVSPNYLPQILPRFTYASEERVKHNSQKTDNSQEEKLQKQDNVGAVDAIEDDKSLSIFQRFKKMYRDYWYVLLPVHIITSLGWFGGFYYMAKSGVDLVAIVEAMGVNEHIPDVLKDSSAGYLAVAYALYKIATPVRYMVTIGGTTISIKYLKGHGYIKPIPPKAKLKEMYEERKENFKEKRQYFADELKQKREQLKERRQTLMRERGQQTQK